MSFLWKSRGGAGAGTAARPPRERAVGHREAAAPATGVAAACAERDGRAPAAAAAPAPANAPITTTTTTAAAAAALEGESAAAVAAASAAIAPPPLLVDWPGALRRVCLRRGVLCATAATVLDDVAAVYRRCNNSNEDHNSDSSSHSQRSSSRRPAAITAVRVELPNADSVTLWPSDGGSDDSLALVIRSAAALSSATTAAAAPAAALATAATTPPPGKTPPRSAARLLLSPLQYLADRLAPHSEYSEDDNDAGAYGGGDFNTASPPPSRAADARALADAAAAAHTAVPRPKVSPHHAVLAVDLAADCARYLQRLVDYAAPAVLPETAVRQWLLQLQQERHNQGDTTHDDDDDEIATLWSRLPDPQLRVVLSCLAGVQRFARRAHGTVPAATLLLLGADGTRSADVRLTLYELQCSIAATEQNLARWRHEAAAAGRAAVAATASAANNNNNAPARSRTGGLPSATKAALTRRRLYAQHAEAAERALLNLLATVEAVETAVVQHTTVAALRAAAQTLQSLRGVTSSLSPALDGDYDNTATDNNKLHAAVDDWRDEMEYAADQHAAVRSAVHDVVEIDDDDLLQELVDAMTFEETAVEPQDHRNDGSAASAAAPGVLALPPPLPPVSQVVATAVRKPSDRPRPLLLPATTGMTTTTATGPRRNPPSTAPRPAEAAVAASPPRRATTNPPPSKKPAGQRLQPACLH